MLSRLTLATMLAMLVAMPARAQDRAVVAEAVSRICEAESPKLVPGAWRDSAKTVAMFVVEEKAAGWAIVWFRTSDRYWMTECSASQKHGTTFRYFLHQLENVSDEPEPSPIGLVSRETYFQLSPPRVTEILKRGETEIRLRAPRQAEPISRFVTDANGRRWLVVNGKWHGPEGQVCARDDKQGTWECATTTK